MSTHHPPSIEEADARNNAGRDRQAPERPHRYRWVILLLLFVIGAGAVVYFLLRQKPASPKSAAQTGLPIPTVQVAAARRGSMGVYVDALGTVTPISTITVYSQVTGKVTAVHYTQGQMVTKDQPLIDIDPRPYQAQLEQAQGTLERDQGLLKQSQMDLARYREASVDQSIARQQLEDQEQAVVQYSGTVRNDMGQVQYAQVQLSYCHITAPVAGRIGLRLVDPGNTIFSGSSNPLVVITQLQPITVVFNVAEDNLVSVRGQILHPQSLPVEVFDRTQQRHLATGHLVAFDNQVDTATGTLRFRGEFDNRDMSLFPNQFVNVRLLVQTLANAVLVPSVAVQHNGTQAFVYVQTGDIVKVRTVKEVATEGEASAVEGLSAGDVVAITGFDKLDDGVQIQVQSNAPARSPATSPTKPGDRP